ncbi:hypothetical protein [Spiroplasma endosymbiont of Virgichneumon dumeticola]|uniref:hypothetical protein n=1 Tax=Spiroplasma endosymbiont of Virgichneumon dumeticola TaxID=3139323 RepID=UPI0035C91720
MKKIVNLLTVLTLFTTTTINVIGCETSQKNLIISKQPDLRDEILSGLLPTCTCGGNNEIEWVQ